jgi:hypothetical protein
MKDLLQKRTLIQAYTVICMGVKHGRSFSGRNRQSIMVYEETIVEGIFDLAGR